MKLTTTEAEARKTLVHTETLLHLAALAHAALTGTQPEDQNHDNL